MLSIAFGGFCLFPCPHETGHTNAKHDIPHNTNGRMNSFQMLKNRMHSVNPCEFHFRLFHSILFQSPTDEYGQMFENRADHPNNEGVCCVGLTRIDYSWQTCSPYCLRNYTQWREIQMAQWYHTLSWTVQFTWPHTCEDSYTWVTMNVRYILLMWEYCMDWRHEFDQM